MIRRSLLTTLILGICAFAGLEGYRLLRYGIEAEVYRARLEQVAADYEELRAQYNQAVLRTAVTELVVEDGRLSVAIRDVTGELLSFDTPFDPSQEIYVDYVVLDGRSLGGERDGRRLPGAHAKPGRPARRAVSGAAGARLRARRERRERRARQLRTRGGAARAGGPARRRRLRVRWTRSSTG